MELLSPGINSDIDTLYLFKLSSSGMVEYHSVDPGVAKPFPRCEHHWARRLEAREKSIERYENSDVPPSWFDPTFAGESWDGD